jgi:hypothetical protein
MTYDADPSRSALAGWFKASALAFVALGFATQTACIKPSMNQLASPASVEDMRTIMHELDLDRELARLVQAVLDVGYRNVDDTEWEALLLEASVEVLGQATPVIAAHGIELTPVAQARIFDGVREALRTASAEAPPHDEALVGAAMVEAVIVGLGELAPEAGRDALRAELGAATGLELGALLDGRKPFARVLTRSVVLGMVDAAATYDPEPIHRFLAEERRAFSSAAADSLEWWRVSFWVAAAGLGAALLALLVLLRRHVLIRRKNERTLRFLAGAIKARESDPAMRELLTTIADPDDPDAIENLNEFYADHPDLRVRARRELVPKEPPAPPQQP